MSQTLEEIAEQLHAADKKVQLIYAFNGTGKTRLSRALKNLVAPKPENGDEGEPSRQKILYYNAFTEDLFYWDNDILNDGEPKLMIQPNSFTDWILKEQGQDRNIITNFQRYTNERLTPRFNEEYTRQDANGNDTTVQAFCEVTFSLGTGGDDAAGNFKISKGEESNFIWSVFYTLLEEVVSVLSVAEPGDRQTDQFNQLQYVFIDDPVSSLDENHLIELAVNLAGLIKNAPPELKFVVTTHNPLFYNVLHNEFQYRTNNSTYRPRDCKQYRLVKKEDGTFVLEDQPNDRPFSYHLFLMSELQTAIRTGQIRKYHFNFMRNILEKTSTFLGYKNWGDLLPRTTDGSADPYMARIINLSSHSAHAGEEVAEPDEDDKRVLGFLFRHVTENYGYRPLEEQPND
ncbi:AAA family ATPase [uncultured Tateyamaria sp.]|uniref:AAA family ATPase n=1 Tax=uncultured Tateyamaria sp. TaxID=455651 RepID=UPI0026162C77|nr:AAA family ATPase [uncultured Tateyamaria sp.]